MIEFILEVFIGILIGTPLIWILLTLGILAIGWCDDK